MRILSQDGMIDVPYEQVILRTQGNYIFYQADVCGASPTNVLAEYSTEAKAKKAMDMLRTAYAGRFITNADISEDFNEQLKELMKGGFGTVIVKDRNDSRIEFDNLNGYFQFPADDELEG